MDINKLLEIYGLQSLAAGALPVLRTHNRLKVFYDFCHPVPMAHDLIGKVMAAFLEEEVLGPGRNQ